MSESLNNTLPALAELLAAPAAAAGATGAPLMPPGVTRNESSTSFTALLAGQLRGAPAGQASAAAQELTDLDTDQPDPVLLTPFWPGAAAGAALQPASAVANSLPTGADMPAAGSSQRTPGLAPLFQQLPSRPGTVNAGPGTGQAQLASLVAVLEGERSSLTQPLTAPDFPGQSPKELPLAGQLNQLSRTAAAAASAPAVATAKAATPGRSESGDASTARDHKTGPLNLSLPAAANQASASAKAHDLMSAAAPAANAQPLFASAGSSAAFLLSDSLPGSRRSLTEITAGTPPAPLSGASLTSAAPPAAPVPLDLAAPVAGDRAMAPTAPALQVAEQVKVMIQGDQREAQLQLHPKELGAVNIRIALHADQASISIEASNPELYRELSSALPRLRQLFMEEGLGMAQLALDMGQSQQQDRDTLDQPGQPNPTAGQAPAEPTAAPAQLMAASRPAQGSSLDLYA